MSYILEALKKSEQARGHGSAPGIQTVHSAGLNYQPPGRSIWPWILIVAILLNLAVLLYFVFAKNQPSPLPASLADQQPVATVASVPSVPVPAQAAPATVPTAPPVQEAPRVIKHTYNRPSKAEIEDAVDISELPEDVRHQIPEMSFTAHVFSSNPQQRSVVINGRFMEEGESLSDDFILKEITSNGVIMDFHGHLFRTTVISGW